MFQPLSRVAACARRARFLSIPASVSDGGAGGFLDNPPANRWPFAFADRLSLLLHDLAQALLDTQSSATKAINAESYFSYFSVAGSGVGGVASSGWVYRAQTLVVFWERARVAGFEPAPSGWSPAGGLAARSSARSTFAPKAAFDAAA